MVDSDQSSESRRDSVMRAVLNAEYNLAPLAAIAFVMFGNKMGLDASQVNIIIGLLAGGSYTFHKVANRD